MNVSRETRASSRERPRNGRIGKLLLSEYPALSETILVESPFAETTRNGRGLRQVALGLTPTRLIVATDVLRTNPDFLFPPGTDASIESFELVSVYPLEYVTLSVFRRRRRRSLKARFVDGRANYYELGGARRKVFWGIWREQVQRLLARKADGSSLSETTVASSSSSSSSSSSAIYLLSSEIKVGKRRDARGERTVFRIWTGYGGAGDYVAPTWTDKNLFLGSSFNELTDGRYKPVPVRFAGASLEDVRCELGDCDVVREKSRHSWPCQTKVGSRTKRAGGLCNVLYARNGGFHGAASYKSSPCNVCRLKESVDVTGRHYECSGMLSEEEFRQHVEGKRPRQQVPERPGDSGTPLPSKVSRFGFGVPEKCRSGLILGPYRGDPDRVSESASRSADPRESIESGVTVWEGGGHRRDAFRGHPRRYAFASAAHFLHALGPWSVQPGERDSAQTLRSRSAISVRRQPSDPQLRLPVSRRQLTASVSCVALTPSPNVVGRAVARRGRVMLFWTPEYWYRPQAAATAYRELRHHLASIRDFRHGQERKQTKRTFFRRVAEQAGSSRAAGRSNGLLERVLSIHGARKRDAKKTRESANVDRPRTAHLRKLLKMNSRVTAWDLDSATLAAQLTMIDRDLFVRIPATEIEALVYQRSSRNAPNLGAWIAYSHRIACLVVSEILAVKRLPMRTRIMARFINAADKCFALGNFQSCRSILAGLQAPPIYRLRRSWSYLRTHHASRYETMEKLSKIYKSPRCSRYRNAWVAADCSSPRMPYVDHLLIKVLELNDWKQVPANLASHSARKRSTVQTVDTLSQGNHLGGDLRAEKMGRNPTESRQCLARRILTATLSRMKLARQRTDETIENDVWTRRQRYLARKFLHRWNAIALGSNERSSRDADQRRKHIRKVAAWLTECQRCAQRYSFPLHSLACEFLLKARYREDRENFLISLKLEPPMTN